MNWDGILHYLGIIFLSLAFFSLLPLIVSLIYDENVFIPFVLTSFIFCALGAFLVKRFKRTKLSLGSLMVLTSLSLISVSFISSIVYLDHLSLIDGLFESVSGFTTTGLTIVQPENLPYSILFFRSLTQWLGGLGMLIAFILLFSSSALSIYYVYKDDITQHRIEETFPFVLKTVFSVYVFITFVGILLFAIVGMPIFDSLSHTLSAVSAGGFSVKTSSIGYYSNLSIEVVAIALMIIGALPYLIHIKIFRKNKRFYLEHSETKLFIAIVFVFSILLSIIFIPAYSQLEGGLFYTISAITSNGFHLGYTHLPDLAKLLLIILMIIGGFAGSLAGGIKLIRAGILGKALGWTSKKIFYPNTAVLPFKYNKKSIGYEELTMVSIFSFAYLIILVVSSIILSFLGYSTVDAFFVSASAEGNVGLSSVDISSLNPIGKLVLIIDMIVGRLEILPFLVLCFSVYSKLRK